MNYHWAITLSFMEEFPELKEAVENILLKEIEKFLKRQEDE